MTHTLIQMLAVLLIEAFVLKFVFSWTILKASGISILLNIVSFFSVQVVIPFIFKNVPPELWYLHSVSTHYYVIMLPLVVVIYCVTVLTEVLVFAFFMSRESKKKVWAAVSGMNLATLCILSLPSILFGAPALAEGFSLVSSADWLQPSGEKIYYVDTTNGFLVCRSPGTNSLAVLYTDNPIFGYRVSTDNERLITLFPSPSNTIRAILCSTGQSALLPGRILNAAQVALAPDAQFVAQYESNAVRFFSFPQADRIAAVSAPEPHPDSFVCWQTNSTDIFYGDDSAVYRAGVSNAVSPALSVSPGLIAPDVVWSISCLNPTNTFICGSLTATVYWTGGIRFDGPDRHMLFSIACRSASVYYNGIGFVNNGDSFLFQLSAFSKEIMALNLANGKVGHVWNGGMAAMNAPPFLCLPPSREQ